MQNPRFVERCVHELRESVPDLEIIEGDRYHPVLAVRVPRFQLPPTVIVDSVSVTIALPRMAGLLPDALIGGVHVSAPIMGMFRGEPTLLPFCDPVDREWLEKTTRYFPLHEARPDLCFPSHYLCLHSDETPARTPREILDLSLDYLGRWEETAFKLARYHGAIVRGLRLGDREESLKWIEHLTEHTSPSLTRAIEAALHDDEEGQASPG